MEKEILEILKAIQLDITGIKDEQQKVNEKLERIEKKIDITYDQVARSAEDITGIKNDLWLCTSLHSSSVPGRQQSGRSGGGLAEVWLS